MRLRKIDRYGSSGTMLNIISGSLEGALSRNEYGGSDASLIFVVAALDQHPEMR
jgi:hypothetical protein